ncbi:MAG: TetR/AcrR family transcriptional regulator [Solirubrobacterales bacterium]
MAIGRPKRQSPSRRGEITRELVLTEGARLFRENGYAGTSTRMLAGALGVQSASLYHHVATKEALLNEICREGWRVMNEAVETAATSSDDGLEALCAVIRSHLTTAIEHRNVFITMLTEARSLSVPHQRAVRRMRSEYSAVLEEVIERAQAQGSLRNDIPSHQLMLVLRNLLSWTLFWYRTDGTMSLDELIALITKMFLEGGATADGSVRAEQIVTAASGSE